MKMFSKKQTTISLIIIAIMILTVPMSAKINSQLNESQSVETSQISVYIGRQDSAVDLAVKSFMQYLPKTINVNTFSDFSTVNLKSNLLVIIAHGTNEGVLGESGLISWMDVGHYISDSSVTKVITVTCDGKALKTFVPNNVEFYGVDGTIDAKLGGYTATAGTMVFLNQISTETQVKQLLTSIDNRQKELLNGNQEIALTAYYYVKQTRKTLFGVPYEEYADLKFRLTGSTATNFYNLGAAVFLATLQLHIAFPDPVTIVLSLLLDLWFHFIQQYSPAGEAFFGFRIQIIPLQVLFAIVGTTGPFTLTPMTLTVGAVPLYSAVMLFNTKGNWVVISGM